MKLKIVQKSSRLLKKMRQERNIQNKIQELRTKHGIRINILETFADIASGKEIKNRYKLEQVTKEFTKHLEKTKEIANLLVKPYISN